MKQNLIIGLLGIIVVALAFLALYGLDRGTWIGSTTTIDGGLLSKNCHYLSLRGLLENPALGGVGPGWQSSSEPNRLYCPFLAE
jgi:hypothetical protein